MCHHGCVRAVPSLALQKQGGVGVLLVGALTGWMQSGSNVEDVLVKEEGNAPPELRNRRRSWYSFAPESHPSTLTPSGTLGVWCCACTGWRCDGPLCCLCWKGTSGARRRSDAMEDAIKQMTARSQETPFGRMVEAQLDRIDAWLMDPTLSAVVVASSLPLCGAEGEESVITDSARTVLQSVFKWQCAVRQLCRVLPIPHPGITVCSRCHAERGKEAGVLEWLQSYRSSCKLCPSHGWFLPLRKTHSSLPCACRCLHCRRCNTAPVSADARWP